MRVFKNLLGNNSKIHVNEIAVTPELLLDDAVIVEHDSNANGSYIKFGNGLMICYGKLTVPRTQVSCYFEFPSSFIGGTIAMSMSGIHNNIAELNRYNIGVDSNGLRFRVYSGENFATKIDIDIIWLAIGMWK